MRISQAEEALKRSWVLSYPSKKKFVFATAVPGTLRAWVADDDFSAVRREDGSWTVDGEIPSADDLKDNFEPVEGVRALKLLYDARAALLRGGN